MISYTLNSDNMELLAGAISLFILIYSAILHEIAHGLVADRLGDPTARLLGRLTLNPIPHIDPLMSLALPISMFLFTPFVFGHSVIFAGAKPVPVDPFNLRDKRLDMAIVSLAGPATNFIIAIVVSLIAHLLFPNLSSIDMLLSTNLLGFTLGTIIFFNILLGIFNLIPIPPLDGSKIFALILPEKEANAYLSISSVGIFIIFFLLAFPVSGFSLENVMGNLLTFSEHLLGL